MKVRLKSAATVADPVHGTHWHPAGAEVEIPQEHYDSALHENLNVGAPDEEQPEPLEDEGEDKPERAPRKRK
jgi:hypothetical protein